MSTALSQIPHSPHQNCLLAALPTDELEQLYPHLELVPMLVGETLGGPDHKLNHVYFPTTSVVSLLNFTEDGKSTKIAIIGNEGVIGMSLFMGWDTMSNIPVVQSAGYAYRLNENLLKQKFNHVMPMQHQMLRYTQALLTQIAQTAVCNQHHSVEQHLCRLLLLYLDRVPSNELTMTQEMIANMLGVRREGITEAAGKLQRKNIIHYSRGHIKVLDRPRLETEVCECYKVLKKEYDQLLSDLITMRSTLLRKKSSLGLSTYRENKRKEKLTNSLTI
ncbi:MULTISPECIES: Crp/Fnr family transcriptional regulator [Nitrosomonas]|uniref:CRP-like cAMP-binding protein n=1 Tax=Nitrosomonas communis TaxID=44574 RepID=A0A0F7KHN8_9PROT|nr:MULTISPECIES: Crp/Fnr family transcriptional regulator [Nitrosomonas]AKH38329.1 Crp/Fnr family transcriptional regulator [Nitrosomonas communis]TYP78865.1 CRP-like cAMP-binding protein [Nitrosomonas communis]UVS60329.1 Crp/Fnr family transcriptional regulator [Nitrosomonas sp. PLL12]